jgi:pimeloyl-ACP methyl ester carboxylesterase
MFVTTVAGTHERPALPRGRFVELPGRGTTFVRDIPGPPGAPVLLLLHGWSATADLNWHPAFAPLARHFRVIAIDHRGHGQGLRSTQPFRLEDCADDVASLAVQLGVERLIAVGYSMGGPIAQLLWQRHPELVDGLVMCATSAAFRSTPRLRMLFGFAAALSNTGTTGPMSALTRTALGMAMRWNGLRGESPWGVEQLSRHDWRQVIEAGHQVGQFDSRPWITSVSVPTAVVVTGDDDVVPTRHQIALARAIPSATMHTLRGGHHECITAPHKFVPMLLDACRNVASRVARMTPITAEVA